jgi:hypothetical protein
VTVPIRVEREDHDRQANARAVFDDCHPPSFFQIRQLGGWHPAARIAPADIAPAITANAAMDVHTYIGRDAIYHRKIEGWPGAKVGRFSSHSRKRQRELGRGGKPSYSNGQAKDWSRHGIAPSVGGAARALFSHLVRKRTMELTRSAFATFSSARRTQREYSRSGRSSFVRVHAVVLRIVVLRIVVLRNKNQARSFH